MSLMTIYVVVYVIALAVSLWGQSTVGGFLQQHPSIANESVMAEFKELARSNMYVALLQIPVLLMGIIFGLILIFRHGFTGLLVVLVVNVLLLLVGKKGKKLEEQVRSLPAATEELGQEHRRVCETWVKKALPDF